MSLFNRTDAGGDGSGSVFPDRGFAHLASIARGDPSLGFDTVAGQPNLQQIVYGTANETGVCPTRLHDLVNTDFSVNADGIDIIIIAVGSDFTRADGSLVTANAGWTFPASGNSNNTSGAVLVVYDTSDSDGEGYCLPKEGGGEVGFPADVILYHELSHALRMANGTLLSLSASGCDASPEENQAEIDENDLRDQIKCDHRDTTSHCSSGGGCPGCGDGGCCVVASAASGSTCSQEVGALRRIRDGFLRRSEIGFDFFSRLHYDYYAFSPEICRKMALSAALRREVLVYFVRPLVRALALIHRRCREGADAAEIGAAFEETLVEADLIESTFPGGLGTALALLEGTAPAASPSGTHLEQLRSLLEERARSSPFIKWALVDPLALYTRALLRRADETDSTAQGRMLCQEIDAWSASVPLTERWSDLSNLDRGRELGFLREALLVSADARSRVAARLVDLLGDSPELMRTLAAQDYAESGRT